MIYPHFIGISIRLISPYNVLYRAGIYLFFISRVALARSRRLLELALNGDGFAVLCWSREGGFFRLYSKTSGKAIFRTERA